MNALRIRRHDISFFPDSARVIIRPFIPDDPQRITTILGRALAMTEEEVVGQLNSVKQEFDSRHFEIDALLRTHFSRIRRHVFTQRPISHERELLIGALFSGEYSLESAAIFNPSIVPHPDQSGLPPGALRFIMSLRATGEGHVSSIEFRSGVIGAGGHIAMDPLSRFVTEGRFFLTPPTTGHGSSPSTRRWDSVAGGCREAGHRGVAMTPNRSSNLSGSSSPGSSSNGGLTR